VSGATMRKKMFVSVAIAALVFAATPSHALEIKKMTLSNGATLLVSEQHQLPMVTVMIEFDAGTRRDPKGKEGLAELTSRSLSQGTKELTAPEFDQKVDFMGSSLGVSAGRDYSTAGMTSLKKYQPETLQLLTGILTEPGLRDADIERKRAEQVAEIKRRKKNRATRPMWNSRKICLATRHMVIRARAIPIRWRNLPTTTCAVSITTTTSWAARSLRWPAT